MAIFAAGRQENSTKISAGNAALCDALNWKNVAGWHFETFLWLLPLGQFRNAAWRPIKGSQDARILYGTTERPENFGDLIHY